MRKKRIYLDTSVISYLRQEDVPDRMAETLEFWEVLKRGRYEVYISEIVIAEITRCAEPKRSELFALLEEIRHLKILPPKSEDDRRHIAAAIFGGCNIIVSWNFKHMVNVQTIDGVRIICLANNVAPLDIYPPAILLERSAPNE